jgi:hypothetical protein
LAAEEAAELTDPGPLEGSDLSIGRQPRSEVSLGFIFSFGLSARYVGDVLSDGAALLQIFVQMVFGSLAGFLCLGLPSLGLYVLFSWGWGLLILGEEEIDDVSGDGE